MKASYITGFKDLFVSRFSLDSRQKLFFFKFLMFGLSSMFLFMFLTLNFNLFLLLLLYSICIVSRIPLRILSWSGFLDMNLIIAIFVSMNMGVSYGIFLATATIVSRIFAGEIDINMFYDLLATCIIVLVVAGLPMSSFVTVTAVISVIYCIFSMVFFVFTNPELFDFSWSFTYMIWNMFFVLKFLPLLKMMF